MQMTLTIDRVGHAGDGIAEREDGPIYVPFTLPGEIVAAEIDHNRAIAVRVLNPSAERVAAPCPHFGTCGGCSVQHWDRAAYLAWKRGQVVAAFAQRGLDPPVEAVVPSSPASRRRAVFTAERSGKRVTLGFNRAGSHEVVAIPECRVLVPAIVDRLDAIASLVAPLVASRRRVRVTVMAADNGLDIAADALGRIDRRVLDALAGRIDDPAIARVTVAGETAYQAREPELNAGSATLFPTPGGFVQAVGAAEAAMAETVLAAADSSKRVADLFCGIGTFSLRLAERTRVTAIDGEATALAALQRASRNSKGLKRLEAVRRDLFDDPLTSRELQPFDAVVFDPPRAGAKAQAEQLAASTVQRIVAVSCNPATLARDARILVDGGYRILRVLPVDQFLWSAHIEAVAVFER